MLQELKTFAAEVKNRKLLAENDLLAAEITLRLIQNSDGKNWQKLVDIPLTTDTFLCRTDKLCGEWVYFAVEGSLSLWDWRVIGAEKRIFDYYHVEEVEILC